MAKVYIPVNNTDDSSNPGGGSPVYEQTFNVASWSLTGPDYFIQISEATHNLGADLIIQVEELSGSFYQQVDVVVRNDNGTVRMLVGDDSRFVGRILIKGE